MTADLRWIFCTRSRADDKIGEWLTGCRFELLYIVYGISVFAQDAVCETEKSRLPRYL